MIYSITVFEVITKIAIFTTFWMSTYPLFRTKHILSWQMASLLGSILIWMSFVRDAHLRERGVIRIVPNYGANWLLVNIVILPTLFFGYCMVGRLPVSITDIFFTNGLVSLFFYCRVTIIESWARQGSMLMSGEKEDYHDKAMNRMYGTTDHEWGWFGWPFKYVIEEEEGFFCMNLKQTDEDGEDEDDGGEDEDEDDDGEDEDDDDGGDEDGDEDEDDGGEDEEEEDDGGDEDEDDEDDEDDGDGDEDDGGDNNKNKNNKKCHMRQIM